MAKFRKKILDVRAWQPIEGLEAQSGVFCNTRTTDLKYINDDLLPAEVGRPSPLQLLDDTSPELLPELTPEALGLVKRHRDMRDHGMRPSEG
jgi:hypothetical protein